jgi:hypothetical protein
MKMLATLVPALLIAACGGGGGGVSDNRTFFEKPQYAAGASSAGQFESAYAPFDRPVQGDLPAFLGVAVLGDSIRFSRPDNWVLRAANDDARTIAWVSPRQYQFAVYDRRDLGRDWDDVLAKYEGELRASGTEVIAQRVPMATANAQGRGYLLRKAVPGAKQAYVAFSREYLLRGPKQVFIVQVVTDARVQRSTLDEVETVLRSIRLQ